MRTILGNILAAALSIVIGWAIHAALFFMREEQNKPDHKDKDEYPRWL